MKEPTFLDRMREIYVNERDYTIGRAGIDPTDLRDVRRAAAIRIRNEILGDAELFEVIEAAVLKIGLSADKVASPKFQEDGSVRLRLTDILRVADNLVVGVVYATEDDWAAYLGIKRDNFSRQERNWHGTRIGVHARISEIRAYRSRTGIARPTTLDAEPYLFERQDEETA